MTRAALTRRRALAAGGAGALAALVTRDTSARATRSPAQDRVVLEYLLGVQRLEAAFYARAVERGALGGDLAAFATAAKAHEDGHVALLASRLRAAPADVELPEDAEALVRDPGRFADAAVTLEDVVVGACNGQAANLTPDALRAVSRVLSVDARHAAWVREIAGRAPAEQPTDVPLTPVEVRAVLRRAGLTT